MGGPERVLWLGVGEGLQCKGHAVRMRRDRRRHKEERAGTQNWFLLN